MDNQEVVLPAREQVVQVCLDPIERNLSLSLGLILTSNMPSVWACPALPALPCYDDYDDYNQWALGYQYFGGITNWENPAGTFPSRSPVKLSNSQPHWVMAADMVMEIDGAWGTTEDSLGRKDWDGLPPHKSSGNLPAGGNHLLADGSVYWVKAQQMYFLHSWDPSWSGTRVSYFYQNPKDFDPALQQASVLNSLLFRY
jgi:hypothetical protein